MKLTKRVFLIASMAAFVGTMVVRADEPTNVAPEAKPNAPIENAPAAPATETSSNEKANAAPVVEKISSVPPPTVVSETDRGLRFNFRGAPLEMVLNYLSEAAGFIIVLEADVKGKVDLFSSQPLTKGEAVTLLNAVLEKNGLTAIRNDRTLTIVSRDDAKKRDIPVKSGSEPNDIPKNNDIVTQILPVRSLNAKQLASDLSSLTPATLTPNEAGNALVITDTQANIHRIAEIIKALDSSTVSTIKVFALKFADAKALATVLKEVFQNAPAESSRSGDFRSMFWDRMRGEGGDSSRDRERSSGRGAANSRVVAVADEYSNSLVVSAPDDLMAIISDLVNEVDKNIEDITAVRVFRLKHADPVEMADLLTSLFPDDSKTSGEDRPRGFFPFSFSSERDRSGGSRSSRESADQSDRTRRKNRVIAVPDRRTASVIVTASKDLIDQVAKMVEELDSNPARKQKVFVYSLENADVQNVEQILQGLFQTGNNRNTTANQNNNNNALNTRQNNATQQQQSAASTTFGTTGGSGVQPPR